MMLTRFLALTLLVVPAFALAQQGYQGRYSPPGAVNPGFFYCGSPGGRTVTCAADVRNGIRLARQISNAPCIEGHSWGISPYGVWVGNGCRAQFALGYGFQGGGYPASAHGGYGYSGQFACESISGDERFCPADTRRGVRIARKLSRADCVMGQSWGFANGGVWVKDGCRAIFVAGE